MRYLIIGFGCAGFCAARAIRENDPDGTVIVISDHEYAPYNPMLTTYYVSGKIPFEALFPFGSLERIRDELRLDIRSGARVRKVRAADRTVELDTGEVLSYDRLLIATGASAFSPRFEGLDPADAFFMRTVDDAVRLKEELDARPHRRALVVGASMVGIKVVELLVNRGIETVLADMAPIMFPLAAYPDVAAEIQRRVEAKGVTMALGCAMQSAEKTADGYICHMSDGSEVTADLIVLCIGTRPNLSMIDPAEIAIGRAITVDTHMQTSCPDVYAAGDCCEGHEMQSGSNMIIGLWANAAYQGAAAGAAMTGAEVHFDGNFLHNITHFMDMDFIGFGDNRVAGEELTSGDIRNGLFVKAVLHEGRLAGVNILDNYRISGAVKNYFYRIMTEGNADISPIQKGILIKEGLRPSFIEKLEGKYHG